MLFDDPLACFTHLLEHYPSDLLAGLNKYVEEDSALNREVKLLIDAHLLNENSTRFNALINQQTQLLSATSLIQNLEGQQIDNYQLTKLIGEGGMSTVYLALRNDNQIEQKVAIKFLSPDISILAGDDLLQMEAQHLSNLAHNNIAQLINIGKTDNGLAYLILELVEGVPIDQYIKHHHLTTAQSLVLFKKICNAIAYAHQNMVIHADIKPENILVTTMGEPKLLDFGISVTLDKLNKSIDSTCPNRVNAASHKFASPEQVDNEPLTTATDIYSLGKLLSALIRCPNDELTTIIDKCIKIKPNDRYSSVIALSDDISRYQHHIPILAKPYTLTYAIKKFAQRFPYFTGFATLSVLSVAILSIILYLLLQKVTDEKETVQAFSGIMNNIIALADPSSDEGFKVTGDNLLTAVIKELNINKTLNEPDKLLLKVQLLRSLVHNDKFDNAKPLIEAVVPAFNQYFEEFSKAEKQFIAVILAYYFNHLGEVHKLDFYYNIAIKNMTSDYPAMPQYEVDLIYAYSLSIKSKSEQSITFLQRVLKDDSIPPNTRAEFQYHMGLSYRELDQPQVSIKYLELAIQTIAGQENSELMLSYYYSTLGRTLVDTKQFEQAEQYFLKAIKLAENNEGGTSEVLMVNINDMASLYLNTAQYHQAIASYQIVYQWILDNFGRENANSATLAFNLCLSYEGLQDADNTLKYCQETEQTFKLVQPDHPYRIRSLLIMTKTYLDLGQSQAVAQQLNQLESLKDNMSKGMINRFNELKTQCCR